MYKRIFFKHIQKYGSLILFVTYWLYINDIYLLFKKRIYNFILPTPGGQTDGQDSNYKILCKAILIFPQTYIEVLVTSIKTYNLSKYNLYIPSSIRNVIWTFHSSSHRLERRTDSDQMITTNLKRVYPKHILRFRSHLQIVSHMFYII